MQTTNIDEKINIKEQRICVVCGDESDGLHFGKSSCRACAAFFRRTVSQRLKYICKRDGNCSIDRGARNMCRSCRYEKCLREGMLTSSVQNQYEQTNSNQMNSLPLLPSESGIGNKRFVSGIEQQKYKDNFINHQSPQYTHLHRMMEGYQQFKSLRKAGQAMIGVFSLSALSGGELPRSHIDTYMKICKINISIMHDILERFFYPFNEVPAADKLKLTHYYGQMFCNAERAFQTYLRFGQGEDLLIMPDGGYVSLSEFHLFFKDSKQVTSEPEQIARVFHNAIQYLIANVVPHMRNIAMQEEEMVALMGMFLWTDSIDISEQSLSKAMQVRNEIIVDLHKYYREIGLNEEGISVRIANLFLLVPKIENVVKMMQENAAITKLFDMMNISEPICMGHV
uniref:Nuclear receptor n=2 Tax=Meloidogyne incognita TaxID=6306 RepID=A0A914LRD3_MELIC